MRVKCLGCGKQYDVDPDKYAGKKIKCKQCQGIISVPTVVEAQDHFDIVEDAGSHAIPITAPLAVASGILERARKSSLRGAVNITLLQRRESSREVIRTAFLTVHGTGEQRTAHLQDLKQQAETISYNTSNLENSIQQFKNVLANEQTKSGLAKHFQNSLLKLTGAAFDELENAYREAVRLLGSPAKAIPLQPVVWNPLKSPQAFRSWYVDVRQVKMESVVTAIANLEQKAAENRKVIDELGRKEREAHQTWLQTSMACLNNTKDRISASDYSNAVHELQQLIKTAPVEMLGQILILLSICQYATGNATDSARHIQDAICFGEAAPTGMDEGYNDLWAKAVAGLPPI